RGARGDRDEPAPSGPQAPGEQPGGAAAGARRGLRRLRRLSLGAPPAARRTSAIDERDVAGVDGALFARAIAEPQSSLRRDARRDPLELVDAHGAPAEGVRLAQLGQERLEPVAEEALVTRLETAQELCQ